MRILKHREKSLLYGMSPTGDADVHRDRIVADGCRVAGVLDSGPRAMKVDPMIALRRDRRSFYGTLNGEEAPRIQPIFMRYPRRQGTIDE
jgi:hypothetical protein